MRKLAGVLTAVMVAAMPAMALADAAGSALGVAPAADATLNNENRTLVVGSDLEAIVKLSRAVAGSFCTARVGTAGRLRINSGPSLFTRFITAK